MIQFVMQAISNSGRGQDDNWHEYDHDQAYHNNV
jgi:hypothetical protein